MTRDWSHLDNFPTDPTPAEVLDNVCELAEMVVANCRALPSMATIEGLHSVHEANAIAGRLILERSTLLRAGNGATALREWASEREGAGTR